jgi:hypothetical protein
VAPESACSSPYSQEPATGPYPEPTGSTPHPATSLHNIDSDHSIPSTPRYSKWSLSFGLTYRNPVYFPLLCVPHVPPISLNKYILWKDEDSSFFYHCNSEQETVAIRGGQTLSLLSKWEIWILHQRKLVILYATFSITTVNFMDLKVQCAIRTEEASIYRTFVGLLESGHLKDRDDNGEIRLKWILR